MARTEKYIARTAAGGDGSVGNPWTIAEGITNVLPGYNMNILDDGTDYALSADFTATVAGTKTDPILWRGYNTTIDDGWQGFGTDGRLVTTHMPKITFTSSAYSIRSTAPYNIFQSIWGVSSKSSGNTMAANHNGVGFIGCKAENDGTGTSCNVLGLFNSGSFAIWCDADQTGASGAGTALYGNAAEAYFYGCRGESVSGAAMTLTAVGQPHTVQNCSLVNSGTEGLAVTGVNTSGSFLLFGNTIQGNAGNGINFLSTNVSSALIFNNMITGNGGYGINTNAAAAFFSLVNNRFRDNVSGNYDVASNCIDMAFNTITTDTGGEETDYNDAPGGDFRLIYGSPGAAASARGINVGAGIVFPVDPAAGGGGIKGYGSA